MPRHIIEGDSIDKHGDVNTSGASDGDVLVWDDNAGEWVPGEVDSNGGGTPEPHAASHEQGGSDEIEASSLATSETNDSLFLKADGSGGVEWSEPPTGDGSDNDSVLRLSDIETYQRFIICAHRGDMSSGDGFPEGTLEGYRSAAAKGVHRVDLDLRRSSEGTWYIMHDSTVTRTTNGSGSIANMTDAQVDNLIINGGGGYNASRHGPMELRVPKLDDVLEALEPYDISYQLDNKTGTSGATLIAQYCVDKGIAHRVAINAYSSAAYNNIKAVDPNIEVVGEDGEWHTPGHSNVNSHEYVYSRAPKKVSGVVSGTGMNAGEFEIVQRLYDYGARGITSNNIEAALAGLRAIESNVSDPDYPRELDDLEDVEITGRQTGHVLTWDGAQGLWVNEFPPNNGGGSPDSLNVVAGTASITHPDTFTDVEHDIPNEPNRGEIQVTLASSLYEANYFWISDIGEETFRLSLNDAPGADNTVEFDWVYVQSSIKSGLVMEVFTESGTWDWNAAGQPDTVDVLVVAGGGGGGAEGGNNAPGGGGAGGVLWVTDHPVSGNVPVVIGAGGQGGFNASVNTSHDRVGKNGEDSEFGSLVAIGGGGGSGAVGFSQDLFDGLNGGSGGGAGAGNANEVGIPGSGVEGQGHDGGNAVGVTSATSRRGGGGGGAGEPGFDAGSTGGNGGEGLDFSEEFGTSVGVDGWFAGGGGGNRASAHGFGGQGGGGDAGTQGQNGVPNTGGGGGASRGSAGNNGGSGGSGIVIVRYPTP